MVVGPAAAGVPPSVGGVPIGSAGQAGTIYAGKTLADGDDFNTTTASDFFTPTNNAGAYMTTRHYGVQSGAPRGLRYANSLAGFEADPWVPGYKNANRGVPVSSYSDTITFGGGTLKTKTRIASAPEQTSMGTVSRNLVSSMVHMARRNMMRAPLLMEMRLRFPYAIASWDQNHPTFWIIQSQPGNGFDGLELDCEGFAPALQFNRNTWNNGVGQFGPTLGTTQAVSKTAYRTYAFEIVQETGVWVVKLWEDGVLVGSGSPDYGGNTFDPTRPFHLMMTSHALSGENVSIWTTAGSAGAEMECDWWRAWMPTGGTYRQPLVGHAQYLADFNTAFSFNLPTPADVWGSGVTTDVIEMIPNEDNSPAQPWVRGLLPASVTRTGNTLAGTISDQPGRLSLARSYTPANGDGCKPQPITICIGPRILVSTISINASTSGTYDLYAQADFGDLSVGATVSVTGLPGWATFNATTGLISYTAPAGASTTAISVTAVNGVGQSVTSSVNLTVAAVVTSFFDDFNRANENLEASPNWTRLDGSAGAAGVRSNACNVLITDTAGAAYVCPDLGSANHYVEANILDINQQFIACRVTDRNNLFAFRRTAGNVIEVYTRIGGTFNLVATHGTAISTDMMRLEVNGSTYTVKKNGVSVGTGAIPGGVPMSTRCGFVARTVSILMDNFGAGLT